MRVLDQLGVVTNDARITQVNSELVQLSKIVSDLNGRIGRNEVDIRAMQQTLTDLNDRTDQNEFHIRRLGDEFAELQESIVQMIRRLDKDFGTIASIFYQNVMYGFRDNGKFSMIGQVFDGTTNNAAINTEKYHNLNLEETVFQIKLLEKIKLIDPNRSLKQHEGESPSTHLSTTCPRDN
jgi:uncharacterized coiled-coil protein SlyX